MTREEVEEQARNYGRQVRLAEDDLLEATRGANRAAWFELLNSIRGTDLEQPARVAYWISYCTDDPEIISKE